MDWKKPVAVILLMVALGFIINDQVKHYQGAEIYEAANRAYSLLRKGFNVTLEVESVDGERMEGTLISVRGSTITVLSNGRIVTIGGPEATEEDVRARFIGINYSGKVYVYKLIPPLRGKLGDIVDNLTVEAHSERFSGILYIDGRVSPIELGELKYRADYLTYGSITIEHMTSEGAVITANMVPIQFLKESLSDHTVYMYGTLYVNSEERNLPLELLEVRSG
ncbi:hypothetical protein A3L12_01120 [Thermococcus sp. P6]|uniref:hypothetical protein n=1 Tax=Thermococcus sp. P6 TaxID=122420 RepID=UPI000B59DFDC|nr:hypothetical protein [Thermococcus sp. P6]ASJ09996.1 hypothetical protein A3L12_01120 [Thermococcus sp. P6]